MNPLEKEITYDELRDLVDETTPLLVLSGSTRHFIRAVKESDTPAKISARFSQFRIQRTLEKQLDRFLWNEGFDEYMVGFLLPACENQAIIRRIANIPYPRLQAVATSLLEPDIEEPELDWSKTTGIVWANPES